jgi:hypothetical protein
MLHMTSYHSVSLKAAKSEGTLHLDLRVGIRNRALSLYLSVYNIISPMYICIYQVVIYVS